MPRKRSKAFTLAELLIALAILGVIATFTIPKVLQSQQDTAWKSKGKEVAGIIASGFQKFAQNNTVSAATTPSDIINSGYINYVKTNTSTPVDQAMGQNSVDCTDTVSGTCYILHNGGTLYVHNEADFNATATTNAIYFIFDPDSTYSGTTNGPGKSVTFYVYFNGRLASDANIANPTCNHFGCWGPNADGDPPWFSWD
jgi:prepilin-type N-terminal cleavage/methylation domain-containing protein